MNDIFHFTAQRGFGMIALKRNRGIYVGNDESKTPPGWGFARVGTKEATPEKLRELADVIENTPESKL